MSAKTLRRLELVDTKQRKLRIKGKKAGVNADINVTPLVDVVLVLLIIFMVVTPLLNSGLELPETYSPKGVHTMQDDLNISIKKSGEIAIGDVPIGDKAIVEKLNAELKKNPFRSVYISADKNLQFRTVRALLSALRDAGVSQAGLMAIPMKEE